MQTQLILEQGVRAKDSLIIANTMQDVEPILERNKELRTMEQRSDWGRHIASIPNVTITQWLNEEYARGNVGIRFGSKEFDELVAKKLRDPDWKYLRTDCSAINGVMGFGG